MAECPEDRSPDAVASEEVLRSCSVSLSTSGAGGRLLRSPPPVTRVRLALSREKLECRDEQGCSEASVSLLEDLVGVDVQDLPPPHDQTACRMIVHFFPRRVERKKTVRRMTVLGVCFDGGGSFGENRAEATKWKEEIKLYSHLRRSRVLSNVDVEDVESKVPTQPPQRHLLVLINPVSGRGKSVQEFQEQVKPLFEMAEINFDILITVRQNHARECMKEYDLSGVDGIVIASGDGLLHEVVNGMMEREDWEEAMKTPIGMLPTGSGNALCASSLYEAGEECNLLNAAFQIIQGGVIPMDIATVETADNKTLYMSILAGWGFISDIDIESENFRKIGETRFLLGALNCIRRKRVYRGRLLYLPWDESDTSTTAPLSQSAPTGSTHLSPSSPPPDLVTASLIPQLLSRGVEEGGDRINKRPDEEGPPLLQESIEAGEREKGDDVFGETQDVLLGESTIDPVMTGAGGNVRDDGQHKMEAMEDTVHKLVKENEVSTEGNVSETAPIQIPTASPLTAEPLEQPQQKHTPLRSSTTSGPRPHLLPKISDSVPSDWKVIEGEFLTVSPLMIPCLSANFFGDPRMSIGTGKIRIMYIRSMSRFGLLSMLTKAEKGTHLERPEVETVDVKAFRLEPSSEEGILTVDGEVVKYGPMQAQIHQHLARVFCCKRV